MKESLKERMGIDNKNPYCGANISFWVFVVVMGLVFIVMFSWGTYNNITNGEICKLNGYEWYSPHTETENGYIMCCQYIFVDHIKDVKCEAIPLTSN